MSAPEHFSRWSSVFFIATLSVLATLAAGALWEMQRLESASNWATHARDVMAEGGRVLQLLTDGETAARGFAVGGEPRFLDPFYVAEHALPLAHSELMRLVADNADQQERALALLSLIDSRLAQLHRVIDARRALGQRAAEELIREEAGQETMSRARQALAQLNAVEEGLYRKRMQASERHVTTTRFALILLGICAPAFLLVSWAFNRRAVQELRAAQRLAHVGEAKLLSTLKSCGDALIVTDDSGKVTMLNPVAQGLTGWREDQARGVPLEEVFKVVNEFTRAPVESPVGRVLREGKVVGLANHSVLIARDGTERPIDDSGAPIRDADGEMIGVVLVFRDVSERRQIELARERLLRAEAERESAVRSNAAKDDFLALVSHELRAPLAAIRGWLHLLLTGMLPTQEARGALERIQRNTRLQERLINDLLDVSRITAGKLEVIRSPIELCAIVDAAIEECMPSAEQKGVDLVLETAQARVLVLGDEQRLVQAISNLIGNGIKFTAAGGRITVRLDAHGDEAVVIVHDTGLGMTPDVLQHLFERFWQADSSNTRQYGGLGLGLTITKHLIEEHQGSIEAASAGLGHGSAFTIRLPTIVSSALSARPPVPGEDSARALHGIHVLVVDDDEDAREALAVLLRGHGARVVAVASSAAAMHAYDHHPPRLVITDISMPGEDGYSLAEKIRERAAAARTVCGLFALTAFATSAAERDALARSFDDYLIKPADPATLAARLCALTQRA